MTYRYNGNKSEGVSAYFQSGTEDLPMDKLQSFWRLRSAGTQWFIEPDLIGNAHLAPSASTIAWAASNPSGGALGSADFSGGSAYWKTPGNSSDYAAENRSKKWWLGVWFYPKTGSNNEVIAARSSASSNGWQLCTDATTDGLALYGNTGSWPGTSDAAITSNSVNFDEWNFGLVGHDGTDLFASLNGGTIATSTYGITAATGTTYGFSFGSWLYSGRELSGYIADVSYWVDVSANATAAEVAALYNGGSGNTLRGF